MSYIKQFLVKQNPLLTDLMPLIDGPEYYDKLVEFVASNKCAIKSNEMAIEWVKSTARYLSWKEYTYICNILELSHLHNINDTLRYAKSGKNINLFKIILKQWDILSEHIENKKKWYGIASAVIAGKHRV